MSTQGEFFELPSPVEQDRSSESRANDGPLPDAKAFIGTSTNGISGTTTQANRRGLKDLSIPKLYYSISEVSRITGLEQYVLRYWETEFDELRPQKNRAGNRIYSNKDIKFILKIKELLREKRYTIEGAKQILKEEIAHERELEKMEAAHDAIVESSDSMASDPSQIVIDDTPKRPQVTIDTSAIEEMRASVKTLKEMLRGK